MTIQQPKPPGHLRAETRKWWSAVLREYELEPHHVRLLTLAAEAWDRAQEARETVARDGSYYHDRFGAPRKHPAVQVELDSRTSFSRLIRELDLDTEHPAEARRPPGLRSVRGGI